MAKPSKLLCRLLRSNALSQISSSEGYISVATLTYKLKSPLEKSEIYSQELA